MTKYEWEKELKRNIQSLPKSEVETVIDYYSELFEDKSERGMSEKEIIREFGNPFDVANRILAEYQGEDAAAGNVNYSHDTHNSRDEGAAANRSAPHSSAAPDKKKGFNVFDALNGVGDTLNKTFSDIARAFKRSDKDANVQPDYDKKYGETYDKKYGNYNYDYQYGENGAGDNPHGIDSRDSFTITDTDKAAKGRTREKAPKAKGFTATKAMFLFPMIIIIIVLGSVLFSLVATGVGMTAGGAFYFATVLIASLSGSVHNLVVAVGTGLGCLGAGLIILWVGIKLSAVFLTICKAYFVGRREEKANG